MKRLFILILATVYLVTSSGATMYYHYCMDKLADWSVWANKEENSCGKCGMEKSENKDNGCCKDEHKWVKIQDEQKAGNSFIQLADLQATPQKFLLYDFTYSSNTIEQLPLAHAPPRSSAQAVYLRNCNFRI